MKHKQNYINLQSVGGLAVKLNLATYRVFSGLVGYELASVMLTGVLMFNAWFLYHFLTGQVTLIKVIHTAETLGAIAR